MPILNKLPCSVFRVLTMKLAMRVPRRTYSQTWPCQSSRGPIGSMRVDQLFESIGAEHKTTIKASSEGVELVRAGPGIIITDPFTAFSALSDAIAVRDPQPRIEYQFGILFSVNRPRSRLSMKLAQIVDRIAHSTSEVHASNR